MDFKPSKQLFIKEQRDTRALRPVLQYLKSKTPGKKFSFCYIEDSNSLITHLNLLENIQIVANYSCWQDMLEALPIELKALGHLVSHHEKLPSEASAWDHLIVGLIKAHFQESEYVIIDLCEDHHSQFNLIQLKRYFQKMPNKTVIASFNMSLWLDLADVVVEKQEIQYKEINLLKIA